jgi:hypothetical protein
MYIPLKTDLNPLYKKGESPLSFIQSTLGRENTKRDTM